MSSPTPDATPGQATERSGETSQAAVGEAASPRQLQPILVPLDGSDLAEHALPYAEALAAPGCQLVLLEVGQAEDDLHLLDRHEGACAQLKTTIGDPVQQILEVARQMGVGLIVMTTHGRGALGRWAFGSVADTVSRTSPVPVMIVRPPADGPPPDATIRRVVAPLDGSLLSAQALPVAEAIARQMNVPVHLVTAVDLSRLLPVDMMPTVAFNAELYEETVNQAKREAEDALAEAAGRLRQGGAEVSFAVRNGPPITVIEDTVQPGDIIVLTSRGRHGVARFVLGSVAEQLIRTAPAPVVLVPVITPHDRPAREQADRARPDAR